MPGALTVLYTLAILGSFVAVIAAFNVGAQPAVIGYLLGAAVGLFIPPLVTHAIVSAIYDLKWRDVSTTP